MTVVDDSIGEAKLDIHNDPATDQVLGYTANGMEWIAPSTGDITAVSTATDSGLAGGATTGDATLTLDVSNLATGTNIQTTAEIAVDDGTNTVKMTLAEPGHPDRWRHPDAAAAHRPPTPATSACLQ